MAQMLHVRFVNRDGSKMLLVNVRRLVVKMLLIALLVMTKSVRTVILAFMKMLPTLVPDAQQVVRSVMMGLLAQNVMRQGF